MTRVTNVATRAGRWSAAHWRATLAGWLALAAIAVVLGVTVETNALADALLALSAFVASLGLSALIAGLAGSRSARRAVIRSA